MEHPMTRNKIVRALVLFCAFIPSGVALWGQTNAPQVGESVEAPRIVIGPGDVLNIQVFDTPELSIEAARVSQGGQVTLPVLGVIGLAGLNAIEAAQRIESELRTRGIMVDPHVTVSIVEYSTQGATLLGEVRIPGVYPTFGRRRLLDMIALGGGLAPSAGKLVTIAHRGDPQHPETIMLVPNAQSLGAQTNPLILPGDTVMVGKAGIVYVLGAVTKPGGYLIDNNEHISLLQALTLAGGWDKAAALSKSRLIRKVPEGHKELILDLKRVLDGRQADVSVQNGDIVFVPMSLGKTVEYEGLTAVVGAAQTAIVYASVNPP
jgi:polysaccharide export outer membrane protein